MKAFWNERERAKEEIQKIHARNEEIWRKTKIRSR